MMYWKVAATSKSIAEYKSEWPLGNTRNFQYRNISTDRKGSHYYNARRDSGGAAAGEMRYKARYSTGGRFAPNTGAFSPARESGGALGHAAGESV
jgi:hypothetical protein